MKFWNWMKCLLGFHDWNVTDRVDEFEYCGFIYETRIEVKACKKCFQRQIQSNRECKGSKHA